MFNLVVYTVFISLMTAAGILVVLTPVIIHKLIYPFYLRLHLAIQRKIKELVG